MKYKLIAADMDGTLLNNSKEVTPKTRKALLNAVEKGIIVTLCTGRPIQGLERYLHLVTPDIPVVTYNGGMVLTSNTRKILFSKNLEHSPAAEIMRRGLKSSAEVIVWSDNRLYVSIMDERADWYGRLSGVKSLPLGRPEDLSCVVKIIWMDKPEKIKGYLSQYEAGPVTGAKAVVSSPEFLEFMDVTVSKSEGLKRIADYCGVSCDEIIAIGDSFNDLDMLQLAGLGVAMGNAPDEVKEAADFITLSNEEDGVAAVLDEFVLG